MRRLQGLPAGMPHRGGPLRGLPDKRVLVHGHCHQKEQALALVPDLQVEVIPSACCGMAGAFGYETEHYSVSMKMGELDLLPAVRAAGAGTLIVADGVSCPASDSRWGGA